MQSELHERLEYLVNYSSQLIFVSGDSAAQQKKTLESFVFQQHDETEIAYVTADPTMELSDYRRQLCRQLLGTLVGSYIRPLNELLAGLNEHVGPILITITQAEHVPDELLQELWDLVLQSRFAGNKQHLNVLLFGESTWAERARKWLPAKNTDTPLLISSQSVATQQPGSELDTMIENRRKAFHEHLAKRNGQEEHLQTRSTSVLASPLFISLVAVMFVAVFGGLIYMQYGDDIKALFGPIDDQFPPVSSVEPGSAFDELKDPAEKAVQEDKPVVSWDRAVAAIDEKDQSKSAAEDNAQPEDLLSFIEDVTAEKVEVPVSQDTPAEPETDTGSEASSFSTGSDFSDTTAENASADELIASITDTSEEIEEAPAQVQEVTPVRTSIPREPMASAGFDEFVSGRKVQPVQPEPQRRSEPEKPLITEAKVGRKPMVLESRPKGQIRDIPEEPAQVSPPPADEPARIATRTQVPATETAQPVREVARVTPPATPSVSPRAAEVTESRTSPVPSVPETPARAEPVFSGSGNYDNEQLFNSIQADDYIVQLAGLKDETLMKEFIKDNNMESFIWIYRTQRYGGDWFVILYNDKFDAFSEANNAVATIPPFQGREKIFIKRGRNVLEEIEKVSQ